MSLISNQSIFKIFSSRQSPVFHRHAHPKRLLALFSRKKEVKKPSPYIIVRAYKEDFEEIIKLMHDSYYSDEPTISALKIRPNNILDERSVKAMTEGYTLVAKCKYNGCIVGACINESISPWDPDMEEKLACSVDSREIKQLLMFYAYMLRAPDLWRCLGVKKIFEMSYLFVRRVHRKKGLGYRLLEESKSLGADAGFPVIRCDATSEHTAKICERLGMQKVAEIPYCSYLDQKLEPIFEPPWPHQSVKIYCDCSPQYNEIQRKLQKKSSFFRLGGQKPKKSDRPHQA